MARKEEIITASHNEKNYPCGIISDKTSHPIIFQIGAMWADQHPRKGLVDKEKVEQWIISYFEFLNDAGGHKFKIDKFIENFRLAMEE